MPQLMIIIQFFTYSPLHPERSPASVDWSTEVHHFLIRSAFDQESEDCLLQMELGSDQIDSFGNQAPSQSFMHAMRAENESVNQARFKMAHFIQEKYEMAADFRSQALTDPLATFQFCFYRGSALHPIMDTSSPAHEGFQIWSPLDILSVLNHGSFPTSIEDLQHLLLSPDRINRTIGLMHMIDQIYLELKMRDFLFEVPQTENRTTVAPLVPAS